MRVGVKDRAIRSEDECQAGILAEWQKQKPARRHSTQAERQMFMIWLQKNRPDLLEFRSRDKWQDVNEWLMKNER
jgi:hypothetical protein